MTPTNDTLRRAERLVLLQLLKLIALIREGFLALEEFVRRALSLLLRGYAKASAYGRGNVMPDEADLFRAHAEAMNQKAYLVRMATEAETGILAVGKRLRARATLYVLRMTGVANEAWADRQIAEEGHEAEGRWVLGSAEHCSGCLAEADRGWRPLTSFSRFPGSGQTPCLSRCRCHIERRGGDRSFSSA
jgi:hypothetical protein